MKTIAIIACLFAWKISRALAESDAVYCQSETFRPRCLVGETVIVSKAVYGRMSDTGRCLQHEEELPTLRDDPKYMGCFEDVLQLVSARCSAQSDCEIRIPDPEMEKTNPCYRHMAKYLEVTYHCIRVVQPDRSCEVTIDSEQKFLLPLSVNNRSDGNSVICGSRERAWLLEAPSGQRVNISLLDFSAGSSSSSSSGDVQQRARTVETASSRCVRQFGFIEDKSANRNINICSSSDATAAHRQRTLYVSRTNKVDIVLHTAQQTAPNFLISVKAVGCSDVVPPSDAWLKRSDDVATVGCYMTRQTWVLTCDHNGRWTGTFGNCTQQLLAIQESSDVIMRPARVLQQTREEVKVVVLAAIIGVSSLVCVVIACVGITWLCRLRGKKSRGHGFGNDALLTSVDVKSTAHHSVASFE